METKVKVIDRGKRYLVLRWIDPETGADRQKSAQTTDRSQAKKLAAQLEADLNEGRYVTPSKVTWEEFRDRFEAEKLPSLAVRTGGSYATALNHVENLMRPSRLADLTAAALSTFQARLRKREIKESSIATHLRHVKAALGWAHSMGMLVRRPEIQLPKRARGSNHMRGRPITAEEFERMLVAVPAISAE